MRRNGVGACVLVLVILTCCGCETGNRGMSISPGARPAVPPRGSLAVDRDGSTLTMDIALADIPEQAHLLAMGLRLPDGGVVSPSTVTVLTAPAESPATAGRAGLRLGASAGPALGGATPSLCVRVAYELPAEAGSIAGSVFSMSLGDPYEQLGRQMGVTAALSTHDGSPMLVDYTYEPAAPRPGPDCPLPPPPAPRASALSFRLRAEPEPVAIITRWSDK